MCLFTSEYVRIFWLIFIPALLFWWLPLLLVWQYLPPPAPATRDTPPEELWTLNQNCVCTWEEERVCVCKSHKFHFVHLGLFWSWKSISINTHLVLICVEEVTCMGLCLIFLSSTDFTSLKSSPSELKARSSGGSRVCMAKAIRHASLIKLLIRTKSTSGGKEIRGFTFIAFMMSWIDGHWVIDYFQMKKLKKSTQNVSKANGLGHHRTRICWQTHLLWGLFQSGTAEHTLTLVCTSYRSRFLTM